MLKLFKKKSLVFYSCDIGILTDQIVSQNAEKESQKLLENLNSQNINIAGIGGTGLIGKSTWKTLLNFYSKEQYLNIYKIYPTITLKTFQVVADTEVEIKIILNTSELEIITKIENFLINIYKEAKTDAKEYIFNDEELHKLLIAINAESALQLEIWAIYHNSCLVCQLEPLDILRINSNNLSRCFHKYTRININLGSNCLNWSKYPNINLNPNLSVRSTFYCLLETNDLFI